MQDRIENSIELNVPISRVWHALTDHLEFGTWFLVIIDSPFRVGQVSKGQITYPGYEHMGFDIVVQKLDHERVFAFTWYPFLETKEGESVESVATLVEFRLQAMAAGTLLTISESGFAALPDDGRREEAFQRNAGGWEQQIKNIAKHVEA